MKKVDKKKKGKRSRRTDQQKSGSNIALKSTSGSADIVKEPKTGTYQTTPKKVLEKRADSKGSMFKYINVVIQFFRESKMELKKVKWPTRKELLAATTMVIVLVLVVSFYLGLIDFILIKIMKQIVG